jgi:hypothetical protein
MVVPERRSRMIPWLKVTFGVSEAADVRGEALEDLRRRMMGQVGFVERQECQRPAETTVEMRDLNEHWPQLCKEAVCVAVCHRRGEGQVTS